VNVSVMAGKLRERSYCVSCYGTAAYETGGCKKWEKETGSYVNTGTADCDCICHDLERAAADKLERLETEIEGLRLELDRWQRAYVQLADIATVELCREETGNEVERR
jgi:hypothetical protein